MHPNETVQKLYTSSQSEHAYETPFSCPSDAYLRVVPRGTRRGRRPRQECPVAASCLHRGRYAAISMASFITVFIDICGTYSVSCFSPTLSNFSKTVTSSLRECFSVTEDSAANWRRDASSLPSSLPAGRRSLPSSAPSPAPASAHTRVAHCSAQPRCASTK